MTGTSSITTTHEALIAELLGDVGRLHDEVQALPQALKDALTPTLAALATATTEARGSIDQQAAAHVTNFRNLLAAEQMAVRNGLRKAMQDEARDALSGAAGEMAMLVKQLHQTAQRSRRTTCAFVIAVMLGSLVAGALGFYGCYLALGLPAHIDLGRAVGAASPVAAANPSAPYSMGPTSDRRAGHLSAAALAGRTVEF